MTKDSDPITPRDPRASDEAEQAEELREAEEIAEEIEGLRGGEEPVITSTIPQAGLDVSGIVEEVEAASPKDADSSQPEPVLEDAKSSQNEPAAKDYDSSQPGPVPEASDSSQPKPAAKASGPSRSAKSSGSTAKAAPSGDGAPPTEAGLGSLGTSTGIISICVIISRITGFARTWSMAFALGASFLASSYQVANNLPEMLYELVMGGILTTAFLPVYVSIIKRNDEQRSNEYASNLMTLIVVILGAVSLLCMIFPQAIIYTQSFYSDQQTMGTAVLFFRFFAIQAVFYGASTIISGLLNAHRDYFWSSAAPIANNLIVIATFLIYAFVAPNQPELALYIIAIGNPLGVFTQLVFQWPALRKHGIRLRPKINLKDPALRETVSIGVPAIIVTICTFVSVSVMNAAAYAFADNGPSILAYARLWYTLPYAFLAVPITTTLFTELADLHASDNRHAMAQTITWGSCQIVFLLVPFMLYLIVFSYPLVSLYHIGAFTAENIGEIAGYLIALAIALPFYGICTFQQKAFSALRKMGMFALFGLIATVAQIVLLAIAVALHQANGELPITIEYIALSSVIFYAVSDILGFIYLRRHLGHSSIGPVVVALLKGLLLGGLGAGVGFGMLWVMTVLIGPYTGFLMTLIYVVVSGCVALAVTFGLALKFHIKEAALIGSLVGRLTRRLKRS